MLYQDPGDLSTFCLVLAISLLAFLNNPIIAVGRIHVSSQLADQHVDHVCILAVIIDLLIIVAISNKEREVPIYQSISTSLLIVVTA